MKLSRKKIMREAERKLKRTNEYQRNRKLFGDEDNYQVLYVLAKGNPSTADKYLVFAGSEDKIIRFPLFGKDDPIWLWGYNFERDLFDYLGHGYEIVGMAMDCHSSIWYSIEAWKGRVDSKNGLQKYLKYCKHSGLSREKLIEEEAYSGMNVMTFFNQNSTRREG